MSIFGVDQESELLRWRAIAGELQQSDVDQAPAANKDLINNQAENALNNQYLMAGYAPSAIPKIKSKIAIIFICLLPLALVSKYFIIFPILLIALEYFRVIKLQSKRAQLFEQDYTALLLSLASAVRSGIDPLQALIDCKKLFDLGTPMFGELQQLQIAIDRGDSEKQVIAHFAATIKHPDLALFRLAFLLARKEGSSLGQCLQRLARVTRHRQSFRRKIRSAVAMQRLSAYGIAASAVVIGLMQYTSNPEGVAKTVAHPAGIPILMAGAGCILLGLAWMLYLARSKI